MAGAFPELVRWVVNIDGLGPPAAALLPPEQIPEAVRAVVRRDRSSAALAERRPWASAARSGCVRASTANRVSSATNSATGIVGAGESSLNGWPPRPRTAGTGRAASSRSGRRPSGGVIDVLMSMPWAMQVLYAMTSDGPGHASASSSALTVWSVVGAERDLGDVHVAVRAGDRARGPSWRCSCRPRRTWRRRRAAWPSTPGRRCSSRPRCRARGCSRCCPSRARGRGRRSRCRRPSRRRRRSTATGGRGASAMASSCAGGRSRGRRRSRRAPAAARRRDRAGPRSRSPSTGRRSRSARDEVGAERPAQLREQARGPASPGLSSAEAHAEAELGVVLEQRVAPGRAAAVAR